MKTKLLFLAALTVLSLGCRSTSESTAPCTCGQPATAVEGCAHPKCLAGETNPDNPDCVCGALDLENKE